MTREVRRFEPSRRDDFFRLHCDANDAGWCYCTAWWVPTWEEFSDRSADENRASRDELLERGEYDGYLLYLETTPVGWCQAGPRDRLEKLVRQFGLEPDDETWAITCFLIAPEHRRTGLSRYLLDEVLKDLRERGVRRVEAFPKHGEESDPLELWNGAEAIFMEAGFSVTRHHPLRPVLSLEL